MIVIDASALLEVLLHTPAGDRIADRIFVPDQTLHAPHLLDLEVLQTLRRYCAARQMAPARALEALLYFHDLPIHRHPHDVLARRIWDLRHNLTPYDAAYLALAEVLPATLLTRDSAIASMRGHFAKIELL